MIECLETTVDKFTFRVAKDRCHTRARLWGQRSGDELLGTARRPGPRRVAHALVASSVKSEIVIEPDIAVVTGESEAPAR